MGRWVLQSAIAIAVLRSERKPLKHTGLHLSEITLGFAP